LGLEAWGLRLEEEWSAWLSFFLKPHASRLF